MRKTLLTLLVCIFSVFTAMADLPFRNHRYDALNVLKVKADNIVFVGNSITNMHEWWEAFGNHKVLNRGVSGAVSTEMLANLDNVLSGRPAKIFLMIGTNDLGTTGMDTPDKVAQNVRIAVQRCVTKSPETEVYVQSILPTKDASNRPGKTLANLTATNDKIKAICEEYQTQNVTYVDLWEDLLEVMQNNKHSLDNLHLAASGYAIWCNKIKQLVNGENGTTVYPATGTTNSYGGLNGSFGMRNSYFNCYPVKTGDILLIGDETIHGGEWHELLQSDKVKNRGTGWGAPGSNDLDVIKSSLPNIFHGTQQPAQVYLYAGMGGFNSATYQEIVNTIKSYAPSAKIYLMSLLSASKTYENSQIQSIAAASGANVEYLDLYAQMGSLLDNPKYFNNGYVYGLGYIKMAEIMAPKMGLSAVKPPMTPETSEPTPFVTIEETTLSGQPIKVAADVAQKVFEKNTMTVAIDITPSGLSSQQSNTIIGSVNSGRSKFFAHVLRKGNAMGVQYTLANNTEGWFTQDDGGTMFNNNRQKLVITMNESTKIYGYYRNGHLLRNIDVSTNSAWGFATFGSLNGSTGAELYLGGIPNSSGNLNHTSGTIHSIRFYDKVLTADEISNLNWDNNGGEPIDPDPEPASESIEIFGTSSETSIPYRIPAIAQAKNGTLIAAADYRYSKEDIGVATDGELDIHARISKDNGKTWETKKVIADGNGQGGSGSAAFNHAFGDPCLVADRESGKVALFSCAGNVSFPRGTTYNHQGIAYVLSEDNGETWATPRDITEQFYTALSNSPYGPVKAMFIGSGKIHQSRYTKVGEYYRLYCSTIVRTAQTPDWNFGNMVCFVYYSDDFGVTWKVLGSTDKAPITSYANEPKVEELPDGSVICSCRDYGGPGGRQLNIFTFTDSEKAEGTWGAEAHSGSSNNGTYGADCNGEILLVPAVRNSDDQQLWLALQSIPAASGRTNVSIYYKALETLDGDFKDPAAFAKDWDGVFECSDRGSAYSTMILKQDGHIGFFFEENRYGITKGYTMVYNDYTISQITNKAYTVCMPEDFDETAIFRTFGQERVDALGEAPIYVGQIESAVSEEVTDALETFNADPTMKNYEALTRAILNNTGGSGEPIKLISGMKYTMVNKANPSIYFTLNGNIGFKGAAKADNDTQEFIFTATSDDKWTIKHAASDVYVGNTVADNQATPQATAANAARFTVVSNTAGESSLTCDNPQVSAHATLHYAPQLENQIVGWTTGEAASFWKIALAPGQDGITNVVNEAETMKNNLIFDLQGRRVKVAEKGVYIVGGKKVILK